MAKRLSDLLLDMKKVDISGVSVVVKKHSVGFDHWVTLEAMAAGADIERDSNGQPIKFRSGGQLHRQQELEAIEALDGIDSWDLLNEAGTDLEPLTVESMTKIIKKAPRWFTSLMGEIYDFNHAEDVETKKKDA